MVIHSRPEYKESVMDSTVPPSQNSHNVQGFSDGSAGNESTCNSGDTGDAGSIPGLGRSPGKTKMATHSSILA